RYLARVVAFGESPLHLGERIPSLGREGVEHGDRAGDVVRRAPRQRAPRCIAEEIDLETRRRAVGREPLLAGEQDDARRERLVAFARSADRLAREEREIVTERCELGRDARDGAAAA